MKLYRVQVDKGLTVVALQCVRLTRLNYISLTCMFPGKVGHKRDSCVRSGGGRETATFIVDLLVHPIGVMQQPGQQLLHLLLYSPSAALTLGPGMWPRSVMKDINFYRHSNHQEVAKTPSLAGDCRFHLILAHPTWHIPFLPTLQPSNCPPANFNFYPSH